MSRWPEDAVPRETILFSNGANTYSLVEPLGDGGNATSFLVLCANGPSRGLPFAAKFFLSDSIGRRRAFLQELAFLRNHPHPAILAVHDFGETFNGKPYYISRYMSTTLKRVIASGTATVLDKLLYASQLCAALSFLARSVPPILHRDLKPENVFVNGRTCVLGDFGMMQRVGDADAEADMPWQARTPDLVRQLNAGPMPTTQSDVFALGLLLYRLFTGVDPLLPASHKSDPVTLKALPSVGGELAPMLDQMLSATLLDDPERRPTPEALQGLFIGLVQGEARRPRVKD